MAYCSVFLYRVPRRKAEAFVQALRPIMKLFEDAGCLSDELLRPKDMTAKFGGASLPSAVELVGDEELWIEIAKFKDASHMKDVHSQVAKNPDLEKLHSRFDLLISGKEVYHAEFEEFYRESENEAGNRPYESPVKGHEKDHFENTSSTK